MVKRYVTSIRPHTSGMVRPDPEGELMLYEDHQATIRSMKDFHDTYVINTNKQISALEKENAELQEGLDELNEHM